MNREIRNALNSKAPKRILSNAKPAKREGSDGEERIAKSNGGVRLYRKELGQWWFTQFQQSDEKNTSSVGIATASDLGTVKIGNGLSITSGGLLTVSSGSDNYYLDGITKSSNTLTFSVNGATNQPFTFGSNAFNSTTIPTNTNQLTNGAGFLTAVATSNIADEAVTLAKLAHVATDIFLGRTSNGTGDVEAMSVSDVTVLLNLDNYLTSVSTLNADKLTAGTIPDARVPASAVTQHVASIVHDSLSGFVANEHIDWTADQGSTNIHSGNYTDTNTNQLTRFYFVDDDGDSVHPSHNHYIKFMNGTGITTNWDATDSAGTSGDPHILTIASTTNGTVTAVGTSGSIAGGTINTTGTITHLTSAGHSHVPTTFNQSGKFLKAGSNSGLSEAWASITESDITDLGTYLTTSQAQSAYLPKSSPTLTADTTLSMNNSKVSARTSAGGGSDGLGSAGQVLHSHGSGGGVYWGTIASAPSVNIYDGDGDEVNLANKWMKFVEGSDLIDINFTDTSDGATDDPYDLTFTINSGNITSVGELSGLTVNGNVYISEYLRHKDDINTHIRFSANENIEITANDKKMMRFEGNASELVINEDHAQIDFRVESDTLSHILFVDASANCIGIGTSNPASLLTVQGDNKGIDIRSADYSNVLIASAGSSGAGLDRGLVVLRENGSNKTLLYGDGSAEFGGNIVVTGADTRQVQIQDTSSDGQAKLQFTNDATSTTMGLFGNDSDKFKIYHDSTWALTFGSGGDATFAGHVIMADSKELRLGNSSDLLLYHNGSNSYLDHYNTGELYIRNRRTSGDILIATRASNGDNVPCVTFNSVGSSTFSGILKVDKAGSGDAIGIFKDPSGNANVLISATASNKNSILNFGDSASAEVGQLDFDHQDNAFALRIDGEEKLMIRTGLAVCGAKSNIVDNNPDNYQISFGGDTADHPRWGFRIDSSNEDLFLDRNLNVVGRTNAMHINKSNGKVTFAGDMQISDDLYFNATSAWIIASGSGGTLRIQTFSTFRVDGVIHGYDDVIAYYSSDPTLKDNAKLIENPLDKLSKINGYTFDWNEKAQKIGKHLTGHDYGVMANEIQDVMPELVETRKNGIRAVKYEKIIPLLIECIKKQQTQINELKGIA